MKRQTKSDRPRQERSNRGPSIREIAQALGVSKSTVSLALSTPGDACPLAPATRERIVQAAEEMGYRTNSVARVMRTGRFNAIALITGAHHPYFLPAELVYSIETHLEQNGFHLIFTWLDREKLVSPEYIPKVLEEWACDGILIHYADDFPQRIQSQIDRFQIPSIWLNNKLDHDCVHPDDHRAAYEATSHLIRLGHSKIAFANFFQYNHYSQCDRRAGYEKAMEEARLEPRLLTPGNTTPLREIRVDERHLQAQEILAAPDRPTAILCYETSVASPILVAALRAGLEIPRDLSLLTFGRMNFNDTGYSISTIQLHLDQVGRMAAEQILYKVNHPGKRLAPQALPITWDSPVTLAPPPPEKKTRPRGRRKP